VSDGCPPSNVYRKKHNECITHTKSEQKFAMKMFGLLLKKILSIKYFIKAAPLCSLSSLVSYFEIFILFGFYTGFLKKKSLVEVRQDKFINYLSKKLRNEAHPVECTFVINRKLGIKVLFTINAFEGIGGVEQWLYQMTSELKARGVEILIFTGITGMMSDKATAKGIPVTSTISEALEFKPDLIHLHHSSSRHISSLLKSIDKNIPIFNLVHGVAPTLCMPFIDKTRRIEYGAVSKLAVQYTSFLTRVSVNRIYLLKNFFTQKSISYAPGFTKQKAAIISSKVPEFYADKWSKLFQKLSIELDVYGNRRNNKIWDYSDVIAQYDFILCTGKTAIDIMGFGKPVILLEQNLLGPAVISENIKFLSDMNFSLASPLVDAVELDDGRALNILKDEINKLQKNEFYKNQKILLRENSLVTAVNQLIQIYEDITANSDSTKN
jgi:hypothetical protein